jgi:protein-disulfide isomerase
MRGLIIALLFLAAGASQAQPPALTDAQRAEFARWWDAQPKSAAFPYDNEGAKVLIVEFADFQCEHCRAMYIALKPILEPYARRPADVKFLYKQFPLNPSCNASVKTMLHVAACDAAAAYVMARPKGTADALKDWMFMHQTELSPATVRRAATDVGRISDFDGGYARAIQEVKTDASIGAALDVNSTPSFFVNGRRVPAGGVPAPYFQALIDLELKRAKP